MAKWGEALPAGKAKGFAFTLSFGSWVGEIVQVADTPAGIRIEKVWIAADVGTALDPGIIEAQLVSGAIYGLSAAMGQEITFADGMVEQSNFHDYDAMRIYQCPEFEVAILENYHKMGGVGEIGTPPAAASARQCRLRADRQAHPHAAAHQAGVVRMRAFARYPDLCCRSSLRAGVALRTGSNPCAAVGGDTAEGPAGMGEDLRGLFASALRQLPCRGRSAALVRRRITATTRVHGFNVQRGADGIGFGNPGLRCTTCHFETQFQRVARTAREPRTGISRRPRWCGSAKSSARDLRPDQGSGTQWRPHARRGRRACARRRACRLGMGSRPRARAGAGLGRGDVSCNRALGGGRRAVPLTAKHPDNQLSGFADS